MDVSRLREQWFQEQGWEVAGFQREVWSAMASRQSGLLHSETGSGKTLAVWLGALPAMKVKGPGKGLQVLWITPLRALASDTVNALHQPLAAMGMDEFKVELRTGDTASSAKQRQNRKMPDALVTTPESLSLLIAQKDARERLANVGLVVVDEWHELMGSKRGVQAELGIARLKQWSPGLQVWGLSATLGNTEEAARVLFGSGGDGMIVQGDSRKTIVIDSLLPPVIETFPWAGHMGMSMVEPVIGEIEKAFSSLVFTNTRAQAELWYQSILDLRPEWEHEIGLHHGSLDPEVRTEVEQKLKEGFLRAVVCTSSLDLGVDFSPVERCIQIGSPKGVARLIQRAGRSGHRPGMVSRVTCVPTHTLELLDIAAVKVAAAERRLEARQYYSKPLDVLCQHLVTVALGGGFKPDDLLREVRTTAAYASLTDEEWQWALDFVHRGGPTLSAYDEYKRVVIRDGVWTMTDRRQALRHRMNIGTIVSDAAMQVRMMRGQRVGSVEESFVAKLKPGDKFYFGGRPLEYVRVSDMTCWVKRATNTKGIIPRWAGGRLPLTNELAQSARERLEEASDGELIGPEMQLASRMFQIQARWSAIPRTDQFLVELVRTREGYHAFLYPFEGRLVHEGLVALLAYRLSRRQPSTFSVASNDYGMELLCQEPFDIVEALEDGLLSTRCVAEDILESLNASEMARRQFREIARVSGLVLQSAPGVQKTMRQLQSSSGLLYDVFSKYEPEHPLLMQAQTEVLEKHLEEDRLVECLTRLGSSELLLRGPKRPTPFAVPILIDRFRNTVSSETADDRIRRMIAQLENAAG